MKGSWSFRPLLEVHFIGSHVALCWLRGKTAATCEGPRLHTNCTFFKRSDRSRCQGSLIIDLFQMHTYFSLSVQSGPERRILVFLKESSLVLAKILYLCPHMHFFQPCLIINLFELMLLWHLNHPFETLHFFCPVHRITSAITSSS